MDNNNFSLNNGENSSQQTTNSAPSNPYSSDSPNNGTTGVYNSNMSGTYDANTTGVYDATQTTYNGNAGNTGSTIPAGLDVELEKNAKNGMIIGIVSLVLNLIFCCIPFFTDWVFSPGWLFIFLEIVGIQKSVQGRKSEKRGMATAGLVMNIVSVVWSVLLVILVIVLKFMD